MTITIIQASYFKLTEESSNGAANLDIIFRLSPDVVSNFSDGKDFSRENTIRLAHLALDNIGFELFRMNWQELIAKRSQSKKSNQWVSMNFTILSSTSCQLIQNINSTARQYIVDSLDDPNTPKKAFSEFLSVQLNIHAAEMERLALGVLEGTKESIPPT